VRADLFIWDLDGKWQDVELPANHDGQFREQLFVVEPQNLVEFLQTLPLGAGSTLVKPVSASVLQVFIEQIAARPKATSSNVRTIRRLSSDSDRHDLLQYLLMANLKLQDYEQTRTNFLARAAHDLRAPLTAASGYAGLLCEQVLGPLNSNQIDLLRRMEYNLKKLTRLASEIFELSVVKQGNRRPELQESSIDTLLRRALDEVAPFGEEKNITVSLDSSESGVPLYLDPEQIVQVLVSLLENAIKFTPKGGHVAVRGYPAGWTSPANHAPLGDRDGQRAAAVPAGAVAYRIDVSDTSPGVAAEQLESVFEEFTPYRGAQDRSGGGLGLAICRMILKAHGGQIWAENHPAGTRLSLVLPAGDLSSRKPVQFNAQLHAASLREVSFTEERLCN
jgi:signal transduction histidine kinase